MTLLSIIERQRISMTKAGEKPAYLLVGDDVYFKLCVECELTQTTVITEEPRNEHTNSFRGLTILSGLPGELRLLCKRP